eukprot:GHVT01082805.1.p1 GENE.GHVT01082805.1~~GHVT01082805.1.p1  ORF type:complete len:914 (+),score=199.43 GHVT01082805.1:1913-4654(+)
MGCGGDGSGSLCAAATGVEGPGQPPSADCSWGSASGSSSTTASGCDSRLVTTACTDDFEVPPKTKHHFERLPASHLLLGAVNRPFGHRVLLPLPSKVPDENFNAYKTMQDTCIEKRNDDALCALAEDQELRWYGGGTYGRNSALQRELPVWASTSNVEKAVRKQDKWIPSSIFGTAPPAMIMKDILSNWHFSMIQANTWKTHPALKLILDKVGPEECKVGATYRKNVLPYLERHWQEDRANELDWTNDPLCELDKIWYDAAIGATVDKTDDMTECEICYCTTPHSDREWSWANTRSFLSQHLRPVQEANARAGWYEARAVAADGGIRTAESAATLGGAAAAWLATASLPSSPPRDDDPWHVDSRPVTPTALCPPRPPPQFFGLDSEDDAPNSQESISPPDLSPGFGHTAVRPITPAASPAGEAAEAEAELLREFVAKIVHQGSVNRQAEKSPVRPVEPLGGGDVEPPDPRVCSSDAFITGDTSTPRRSPLAKGERVPPNSHATSPLPLHCRGHRANADAATGSGSPRKPSATAGHLRPPEPFADGGASAAARHLQVAGDRESVRATSLRWQPRGARTAHAVSGDDLPPVATGKDTATRMLQYMNRKSKQPLGKTSFFQSSNQPRAECSSASARKHPHQPLLRGSRGLARMVAGTSQIEPKRRTGVDRGETTKGSTWQFKSRVLQHPNSGEPRTAGPSPQLAAAAPRSLNSSCPSATAPTRPGATAPATAKRKSHRGSMSKDRIRVKEGVANDGASARETSARVERPRRDGNTEMLDRCVERRKRALAEINTTKLTTFQKRRAIEQSPCVNAPCPRGGGGRYVHPRPPTANHSRNSVAAAHNKPTCRRSANSNPPQVAAATAGVNTTTRSPLLPKLSARTRAKIANPSRISPAGLGVGSRPPWNTGRRSSGVSR